MEFGKQTESYMEKKNRYWFNCEKWLLNVNTLIDHSPYGGGARANDETNNVVKNPNWREADQARVVQRLDNAIHRINHYPADSVVCFVNIYPVDSD